MSDIQYDAIYDTARYDQSAYNTLIVEETMSYSDDVQSSQIFIVDVAVSFGLSDETRMTTTHTAKENIGYADAVSQDISLIASEVFGLSDIALQMPKYVAKEKNIYSDRTQMTIGYLAQENLGYADDAEIGFISIVRDVIDKDLKIQNSQSKDFSILRDIEKDFSIDKEQNKEFDR